MQGPIPYRVLLAQNRESPDNSVKVFFERRNVEVFECEDGIEAIRESFAKNPDLIILDVKLPRLNGFQCARVLKKNPTMNATPIIHMGASNNPIEQYWTTACGGDGYLQKPVSEMDLEEYLGRLLRGGGNKRRVFGPVNMIQDLEDFSILTLASKITEQELLRANILNEINRVDILAMPTNELVMALMAIINSLYGFSLGVALLLHDQHKEFLFYQNGRVDQNHLDAVKELILKYLEQQHKIYLNSAEIEQNILQSAQDGKVSGQPEEVYIHTKESGPIRSVLAFENIGFDELQRDEQGILQVAFDLAEGVLEKKIFYEMSQRLSIIDAPMEGFSISFFMAVLEREIENSSRNRYPLILFTIAISNFKDITKELSNQEGYNFIGLINNIILKTTRKSDIVARWDVASFAFLITHTPLEKARIAQKRISNFIKKELSGRITPSIQITPSLGISQFDPERDRTPESFFSSAKPKQPSQKGLPKQPPKQ
jgi:diguanylate cyclase (GGDEF)-like protein